MPNELKSTEPKSAEHPTIAESEAKARDRAATADHLIGCCQKDIQDLQGQISALRSDVERLRTLFNQLNR